MTAIDAALSVGARREYLSSSGQVGKMSDDKPDDLVSQLDSDDWIRRGIAVHLLGAFPEILVSCISRIFELTFDDVRPIAAYAEGAIKETRSAAIPFLLDETKSPVACRRQRAIELLGQVGFWCGGAARLAAQELEPHRDSSPEWGNQRDDVLAAAVRLTFDPDLSVRFAAASLLEDLGLNQNQTIPILIDVLEHGTTFQRKWAASVSDESALLHEPLAPR